MEAVDVLLGDDGSLHLELAQAGRHRELHDDPVDLGIAIEPSERREQLALGHVGGQIDLLAADAHVGARLVFGADVDA